MKSRPFLPWWVIAFAVVILALLLSAPFLLKGNPVAHLFFNLSVAVFTTLVSVHATIYYSETRAREELTRYGLQAWRSLESLQVKVSQHLGADSVPDITLQAWTMDIDAAKWAWRDLLRDIFQLHDRLQIETDEVIQRYKAAIADSSSAQERAKLEQKQAAEVTQLVSRAPLPIKLPEEVTCPNCSARMTARVGPGPGDIGWPVCPNCGTRFPALRESDGTVKVGDRPVVATIEEKCPHCEEALSLRLYENRALSFLVICPKCRTHIQFAGSADGHTLDDLGIANATFDCPHCGQSSGCWIAPGRRVSFVTQCKMCAENVRVIGTHDRFEVHAT